MQRFNLLRTTFKLRAQMGLTFLQFLLLLAVAGALVALLLRFFLASEPSAQATQAILAAPVISVLS